MIDWNICQPEVMTITSSNQIVIRLAKVVSDLDPICNKLYSDKLSTLKGFYNRRGYCIGYSFDFKEDPKILLMDFYAVIDYIKEEKSPKFPVFPKLPKKDSKITFVKYGNLLENRLYTLIYRKKKDV